MKTIFVTIKEFLENGGTLEVGRIIYREEARQFDSKKFEANEFLKSSLEHGEYIGRNEEQGTYLIKNASFKSFPLTETLGYVKIEATPHYK